MLGACSLFNGEGYLLLGSYNSGGAQPWAGVLTSSAFFWDKVGTGSERSRTGCQKWLKGRHSEALVGARIGCAITVCATWLLDTCRIFLRVAALGMTTLPCVHHSADSHYSTSPYLDCSRVGRIFTDFATDLEDVGFR